MSAVAAGALFLPRLLIRSRRLLAAFTAALIIPERGVSERISRCSCQINLPFRARPASDRPDDPTAKETAAEAASRIIHFDLFLSLFVRETRRVAFREVQL